MNIHSGTLPYYDSGASTYTEDRNLSSQYISNSSADTSLSYCSQQTNVQDAYSQDSSISSSGSRLVHNEHPLRQHSLSQHAYAHQRNLQQISPNESTPVQSFACGIDKSFMLLPNRMHMKINATKAKEQYQERKKSGLKWDWNIHQHDDTFASLSPICESTTTPGDCIPSQVSYQDIEVGMSHRHSVNPQDYLNCMETEKEPSFNLKSNSQASPTAHLHAESNAQNAHGESSQLQTSSQSTAQVNIPLTINSVALEEKQFIPRNCEDSVSLQSIPRLDLTSACIQKLMPSKTLMFVTTRTVFCGVCGRRKQNTKYVDYNASLLGALPESIKGFKIKICESCSKCTLMEALEAIMRIKVKHFTPFCEARRKHIERLMNCKSGNESIHLMEAQSNATCLSSSKKNRSVKPLQSKLAKNTVNRVKQSYRQKLNQSNIDSTRRCVKSNTNVHNSGSSCNRTSLQGSNTSIFEVSLHTLERKVDDASRTPKTPRKDKDDGYIATTSRQCRESLKPFKSLLTTTPDRMPFKKRICSLLSPSSEDQQDDAVHSPWSKANLLSRNASPYQPCSHSPSSIVQKRSVDQMYYEEGENVYHGPSQKRRRIFNE